jgi:hypothetical protein
MWSGGGGLELEDGRRYLATTNVWSSKLEFQTDSNTSLFVLKSRGVIHQGAELTIEREALKIPEMPWMILLGFYLVVMMRQDGGGAAAAAAAG